MADVLIVKVGDQRCALPLPLVVEVALMVQIVPIPGLSAPLIGYIRFRGQAIAVVDLAQRLGEPTKRSVDLEEQLVVTRLSDRLLALRVDRVLEVQRCDMAPTPLELSASPVAGVVPQDDGSLLVVDLRQLLSLEERRSVAEALAPLQGTDHTT